MFTIFVFFYLFIYQSFSSQKYSEKLFILRDVTDLDVYREQSVLLMRWDTVDDGSPTPGPHTL